MRYSRNKTELNEVPASSVRSGLEAIDNDGVNIFDMQEGENATPISLMHFYGDDSRSEVVIDGANNIYVAAQTQSKYISNDWEWFPENLWRQTGWSCNKDNTQVVQMYYGQVSWAEVKMMELMCLTFIRQMAIYM